MLFAGRVSRTDAEGALNQGIKQRAQLQKAAQCRPDRGIAGNPAFRETPLALTRDPLPLREGTRQQGRQRTPMQKQGTPASCLIKAQAQGLRTDLSQVAS